MGRTLRKRTSLGAVALLAVLALLPGAAASGAEWSGHPLGGEAAASQLFGVSCPSTSLCVAVGGNNTIASSADPLAPGGWKAVYVDEGVVAGSPNQRQIKGVSCPSASLCVAVSGLGKIITSTEPTGDASAWSVADINPTGPNTHFYGVSCPTTGLCVAVGGGGTIAVSTDPTGGAAAWTITHLAEPLELRAVSCNSPSFCVGVGDNGTGTRPQASNVAEAVSSTAPLAGTWQTSAIPGAHGSLFGVSCPAMPLCVGGDMFGNVVGSTDPTGPTASWSSFSGGVSVQITGVSCSSPAQCLIVDDNGDALTSSEPLSGTSSWTVQNLIPYSIEPPIPNARFSASCLSGAFCAIGATGQVFTSTNPTDPPPAPVKPIAKSGSGKSGKHKVRPKRPRVILIPGQAAEVPAPGGKALLQFRFHVKPKFQIRGYVCSFGGGKMRPCKSPQRHQVGVGHYVFRVRAVGWTGLKGREASARVQVCRQTVVTGGSCR
jgi:hypothetical protein